MQLLELLSISIALGLDASGVCLSLGLDSKINRKIAILIVIIFGFFQFLLFYIGGFAGYFFNNYIIEIPNFFGGIILLILGILMTGESFKEEKFLILKFFVIIILGISVSIDALIVGFTLSKIISNTFVLLSNSLFVGLVTSILCFISFAICREIRRIAFVKKYAGMLGGVVLIFFGFKMILS